MYISEKEESNDHGSSVLSLSNKARRNYGKYYNIEFKVTTEEMVSNTFAGIEGWASLKPSQWIKTKLITSDQ